MSKLLEARDLLIERGIHREGGLESKDGRLCALGALAVAYTGGAANPLYEDEHYAYDPADPQHKADLKALAVVARTRIRSLAADRFALYHLSDASIVYRYNDTFAEADEDILTLFTDAS